MTSGKAFDSETTEGGSSTSRAAHTSRTSTDLWRNKLR